MVDSKVFGELLDVLLGCLCLAVEQCRNGNFIPAQLFRNGFERYLLLCLRFKESDGRRGQLRVLRSLRGLALARRFLKAHAYIKRGERHGGSWSEFLVEWCQSICTASKGL
jgi:hypothetical protein